MELFYAPRYGFPMPVHLNKLAGRPKVLGSEATDVLADMLNSLRLTTLVYGRMELRAPWGMAPPDTGSAHLYVVSRGGALLEMEGERKTVTLSAGDVALLPHGGKHVLRDSKTSPVISAPHAEGDCRRAFAKSPLHVGGKGAPTGLVVALFRFGSTQRPALFQGLPKIIHVAATDPDAPAWLSSAVQVLSAESVSRGPGGTVVMSRLTDVIFVHALRTHMSRTPRGEHGICALNDPHIGRVLALIHDSPGEPWTVGSLATAVALSRSGFAARFHALVGQPPLEYLAQWRMITAAQLLSESELGVAEVAQRVGYRSDAAFQRAFKRLQGMAPGAFRRARNRAP